MAYYVANNEINQAGRLNATTGFLTQICLSAESGTKARRGGICDVVVGPYGAPHATDCEAIWVLQRETVTGTAGNTTASPPLNPADAACDTITDYHHSIEPTYTASTQLLTITHNQRASARWVAAPGMELIWPATDENGIGAQAKISTGSAYASGWSAVIIFQEY